MRGQAYKLGYAAGYHAGKRGANKSKKQKPLPSSEEIIDYCENLVENTQDLNESVVETVRHFIIKYTTKVKR